MAASVGAFILSAGATTTAATGGALFFAQYAVGYLATTALTSTVLNALAPKPSLSNAGATGYQVAGKSAAADHQVIYGTTRAGGVIVYDATTGTDNKYLHRVVAFAGHEIEEYTTFYLNDEALTLDSDGNVTSPSRYNGYVRINTHLGTDDQTADSDLVSEVGEWTTNHRLRGVAYAYFRLKYDQDVFPNGVPEISCVIKGKKVYDPRTSTTAWSDNPALCIRDYLTSDYGLAESTSRIDDELVKTAANVCEYLNYPTLSGGDRFTLNGNFVTSVTPHDLLTDMLTSMGGLLWYSQGKWRMKPAYYTASVLDLNEDDLRSSISVATRHSRRNNFNEVKGTFRGAETNYQPTDYNPVFNITDADGGLTVGQPYAIHELGNTNWNTVAGTSGVTYAVGDVFVAATIGTGTGKANYWLGVDGGDKSTIDLNLPFTDDFDISRRIARIMLERNRQQLTVQAKFGMRAFQVQVGDTVRITNSRFGWTNKEFEVVNWSFGLADDKDLQTDLTLREVSSNVFDDVDDGAALELDNTSLDSPFDVQAPSLDAAVVSTHVNEDGTTVPSITFSWSVTNPQLVEYYEFQYKLTGDTTYNTRIVKDGEYTLAPALSGSAYNYRVRAVNQLGVKSQFVSGASTASTGNDATTPAKPTSPSAAAGYQSITLTWTAPQYNVDAQGDPDNNSPLKDLFQYRIYRGTTTNPTTLVGRVSGEIFTDSGLNDGTTYYYRIKAVDFTGNESDYSDNASATTNSALLDGFNSATVFLYKKNTSPTNAPDDPTGTFTYTFSTGALSGGTLDGWSQTPPTLSEGDYMWAITATAASRTSTDSIPASEFSDAIVFTESAEAYRAATVTLYKKNTSGTTAPDDPTGTFTYTFATAALSGGTLDGWSQSAPSLDKGEYLWVIQASAFNNATTDSIAASEFSAAVIGGIGGIDGTSAKVLRLTADEQTFTYDGDGDADPASQTITFTADLQNTTDTTATFTTDPSVTLGGTGNSRTLTVANFGSNTSVSVTASADSGAATDTFTVYRLQQGSIGVDGLSALTVILSNESHTLAAATDGTVSSYTGSGTTIRLFEGTTELAYDGSGTTDGTWTLSASGTGITAGSLTDSGNYVTVGDHSAMTADNATVTYTITGKRSGGASISLTKTQSLSKSKQGATGTGTTGSRGAGRWHIGVTSLPTTSSGADTDFTNAIGDPVDLDQAFFYTGTLANPTAQGIWIYDESDDEWDEQVEYFDGGLLIDGTVTADHLSASSISALGLTIGTLSSAATGARLELKDDRIQVYDSGGTVRVKIGNLS